MQAREDANMVAVRRFLNGFWRHESEGRAMAYLLLRALQDDVADDDLCGATNGQSLGGPPWPADLSSVGRRQLGLQTW